MYTILADISEQSALPSELLLNSIASVGNRVDAQLDGIHAIVALSVDVSGDVSHEAMDAVSEAKTSTELVRLFKFHVYAIFCPFLFSLNI